jgi:hypothetical protein
VKYFTAIITLMATFAAVSCKTPQYYTKISEVSQNYQAFDGTYLDPLKDEKIEKPDTGNAKYDAFFKEAYKTYILIQFAKKVIKNYNQKAAANEDLTLENNAITALLASIGELIDNCKKLINTAKDLAASAKNDISPMNLPFVIKSLTDSSDKLQKSISEITSVANEIKSLKGGKVPASVPGGPGGPGGETIKRAKLRDLLYNYRKLQGEKFMGTLKPVKFYTTVPPALKKGYDLENKRLLLTRTGNGKTSIIVIIPSDKSGEIAEKIKSKAKMDIIYTPAGVFQKKIPVVEYIDDYREEGK